MNARALRSVRARSAKGDTYHHGDLRRSLMDEGLKMIRRGGAEALSFRELARRLGVTYGAPHYHFAERDDLFAAIAEEAFAQLVALVQQRFAEAGEVAPIEQLRIAARTYLEFAMSEKARYAVMFLPQLRDRTRFASLHATGGQALLLLAEGFVAAGWPVADAGPRAVACWATLHGFASLANEGFLDAAPDGLEPLAREVVETATRSA